MPSSSSTRRATLAIALLIPACLFAAGGTGTRSDEGTNPPQSDSTPAPTNLLANPGFERNRGVGTIPPHWHALDQNFEYARWIAPRIERRIGDIGPRTGRYMVGLATDMLGVDTNDEEVHILRSALHQTITVPGRTRGTFSLYYNDLGSSALCHIAAIRLAYTVNTTDMTRIKFPASFNLESGPPTIGPALWSKPFFRVSQQLPHSQTAVGDWSLASIPVVMDSSDAGVQLTLWIGIFENQRSTELGYYRIDDASFTVTPAAQTRTTRPAR